jgi:hypothetical protein
MTLKIYFNYNFNYYNYKMSQSSIATLHQLSFVAGLILIIVGFSLPGPTEEDPSKNINTKFYLKIVGFSLIILYFALIGYVGFRVYKGVQKYKKTNIVF